MDFFSVSLLRAFLISAGRERQSELRNLVLDLVLDLDLDLDLVLDLQGTS